MRVNDMKKALILLMLLGFGFGLLGCGGSTTTESEGVLETDGSQDSIFDTISQALKEVFEPKE